MRASASVKGLRKCASRYLKEELQQSIREGGVCPRKMLRGPAGFRPEWTSSSQASSLTLLLVLLHTVGLSSSRSCSCGSCGTSGHYICVLGRKNREASRAKGGWGQNMSLYFREECFYQLPSYLTCAPTSSAGSRSWGYPCSQGSLE